MAPSLPKAVVLTRASHTVLDIHVLSVYCITVFSATPVPLVRSSAMICKDGTDNHKRAEWISVAN